MARIAILGTGAWGTALANILLENRHKVLMWGINPKEIKDLEKGYNKKYFGENKLFSKPTILTEDLKDISNFSPEYVLLAVPSHFISEVIQTSLSVIKSKPVFINVAKGLDPVTNDVWSKTIHKLIVGNSNGLVTLIGPSFATEVFKNHPTIINVVSRNMDVAKKVAKLFNNSHFKCAECMDEEGSEIFAALKNVMAIAMGIANEYHTSINTRAAMLAQTTKEIALLVEAMGGNISTALQFCGIGDIYLTCTDEKSRNFSFGKQIAILGIEQAISNNDKTVEGYKTSETAYKLIKKYKISAPVLINTYQILFENKNPNELVKSVMQEII